MDNITRACILIAEYLLGKDLSEGDEREAAVMAIAKALEDAEDRNR
jgi:hypothetical protein